MPCGESGGKFIRQLWLQIMQRHIKGAMDTGMLIIAMPKEEVKKPEEGVRAGRERKFNIAEERRWSFEFQISYQNFMVKIILFSGDIC